jgi:protein TonB
VLGAARADYGALAVARIRARKFYPAAALAAREGGAVGVLFVVAASGRIAHVTITRSSGSATLDEAARAIVGAIELPPPPGGFYSGATQLDFIAP